MLEVCLVIIHVNADLAIYIIACIYLKYRDINFTNKQLIRDMIIPVSQH